jgi:hypothetical protein
MENHASDNAVHYLYFDGTNTYDTFEWTKEDDSLTKSAGTSANKTKGRRYANGRRPGMPSYVTVIPSSHPLDDPGINVPWMAYCSSPFLKEPHRLIPIPGPFNVRHAPYALGYADNTSLFADDLGLPQSIDLYTAANLMRQSPERVLLIRNKNMTPIRAPFSPPVPFKDHELHCSYRVSSSTNVAGWHIPLAFDLTLFPHTEGNRLLGMDAHGLTEASMAVSEVPDFEFQPGKTAVTDLRIRDHGRLIDAVAYAVTNEALPGTNDPRAIYALANAVRMAPLDPVPGIRRRIILLYALLGGLACFPAITLMRGVMQGKAGKQKQRQN